MKSRHSQQSFVSNDEIRIEFSIRAEIRFLFFYSSTVLTLYHCCFFVTPYLNPQNCRKLYGQFLAIATSKLAAHRKKGIGVHMQLWIPECPFLYYRKSQDLLMHENWERQDPRVRENGGKIFNKAIMDCFY